MRILRVSAQNFRLLERVEIDLEHGLNLISGDNAAGKSTFLEALRTASLGRAAAGRPTDAVGPYGRDWRIEVQAEDSRAGTSWWQGAAFDGSNLFLRRDGVDATTQELAHGLPLALLDPGSHGLIDEGPSQRRRFLDWGLFHVEPSFLGAWRRYRRILRQRNAALRMGVSDESLNAWDNEFVSAAEALSSLQIGQCRRIEPVALHLLESLVGEGPWSVRLYPGWNTEHELYRVTEDARSGDRRLGMTRHGPHRSDIRLTRAGHQARHRVSRGEEKLAAAALLLAQAVEIGRATDRIPILLFDDLPAELGVNAQRRLLQHLVGSGAQVVLTAQIEAREVLSDYCHAMFHVEHGRFSKMIK